MPQYWILRSEGKEKGPVDSKKVREWVREGVIPTSAHIREAEGGDWRLIGQREEFKHLFKQESPPREGAEAFPAKKARPGTGQAEGFIIKDALSFGWNTAFKNLDFFLPVMLILLVFVAVDFLIDNIVTGNFVRILAYISYYAVSMIFQLGVIKATLLYCDGHKASLPVLFSQGNLLVKFVLASVLYSLAVFAGTVLLIIPGIIWSIKFFFYDYFIVDRNSGVLESVRMSASITKGYKWQLLGFGILLILINFLGLLTLGVGLFFTMPATLLATAYVYRQLEKDAFERPDAEIATGKENI